MSIDTTAAQAGEHMAAAGESVRADVHALTNVGPDALTVGDLYNASGTLTELAARLEQAAGHYRRLVADFDRGGPRAVR